MKQPIEIIAERIGKHEAAAVVDLLRESGWIIVRHDAIRKAQADERRCYSDNTNEGAQPMQQGGAL
jgi:hypothetical protein